MKNKTDRRKVKLVTLESVDGKSVISAPLDTILEALKSKPNTVAKRIIRKVVLGI